MPYQSDNSQQNRPQWGVGRSIWAGTPLPPIPERVLDGIPGFIAWLALLLCIASAVAFPRFILFLAAIISAYSAIRFLLAGIANAIGLRIIKQWEQTDWKQKYHEDSNQHSLEWDDVHHVVIIPNYKEPLTVLRRTLDGLQAQYEAEERLTIVLAMEAAEQGCVEKAQTLKQEYARKFAHIYFTVHPKGLPGEIQCKSANEAWAARWVKRKLVDELNYKLDHILVTTMDADTRWHPQHFYALTYLFAVDEQRHYHFWQAPIRYHGNIWDINPLMRTVNAYATAFELAYLAADWWMAMPMSSYALSMKLLENSGNWDGDVIADEWHMLIKAYFAQGGKVELQHVFLPFLADATQGDNLLDAIKQRYSQTLRHAWGSKEVGYMLAKMIENPQVPFVPSLKLLLRIAHDILLAGAGWIILTVGSQLPILLHPEIAPFQLDDVLANPEPLNYALGNLIRDPVWLLISLSAALVSILVVVFLVQDIIVRPPRTSPLTIKEVILTILSIPFMLILTMLVVAFPTLVAQTRLLLGIPLQFVVTEKV